MVYRFALVCPEQWLINTAFGACLPDLFLSCRQIMAEAVPIWSTENKFQIAVPIHNEDVDEDPGYKLLTSIRNGVRRFLCSYLQSARFTNTSLLIYQESFDPFEGTVHIRLSSTGSEQDIWVRAKLNRGDSKALEVMLLRFLTPIATKPGFTGISSEDMLQIVSKVRSHVGDDRGLGSEKAEFEGLKAGGVWASL
ncbi:hypothetical protein M8818_004345 [Zalaria obscura]|uniref:Uncharacterized protein n=1 Tax=Zalaria obscura TaxID=2024903 RepID=A0ACC3SAV7_9PEZI